MKARHLAVLGLCIILAVRAGSFVSRRSADHPQPGEVWAMEDKDPFHKSHRIRILEVKDGYVRYCYIDDAKGRDFGDTSSPEFFVRDVYHKQQ